MSRQTDTYRWQASFHSNHDFWRVYKCNVYLMFLEIYELELNILHHSFYFDLLAIVNAEWWWPPPKILMPHYWHNFYHINFLQLVLCYPGYERSSSAKKHFLRSLFFYCGRKSFEIFLRIFGSGIDLKVKKTPNNEVQKETIINFYFSLR